MDYSDGQRDVLNNLLPRAPPLDVSPNTLCLEIRKEVDGAGGDPREHHREGKTHGSDIPSAFANITKTNISSTQHPNPTAPKDSSGRTPVENLQPDGSEIRCSRSHTPYQWAPDNLLFGIGSGQKGVEPPIRTDPLGTFIRLRS